MKNEKHMYVAQASSVLVVVNKQTQPKTSPHNEGGRYISPRYVSFLWMNLILAVYSRYMNIL